MQKKNPMFSNGIFKSAIPSSKLQAAFTGRNTGQVDGWKALSYLELFLSTAEYRKGSFDDAV